MTLEHASPETNKGSPRLKALTKGDLSDSIIETLRIVRFSHGNRVAFIFRIKT